VHKLSTTAGPHSSLGGALSVPPDSSVATRGMARDIERNCLVALVY
jgi:hypothetical protein